MSYIRFNEDREFVEGKSKMYVYCGTDDKISQNGYSDEDMVNMLMEWWKTDETEFKEWFIKKLANRLEIKDKLKKDAFLVKGDKNE